MEDEVAFAKVAHLKLAASLLREICGGVPSSIHGAPQLQRSTPQSAGQCMGCILTLDVLSAGVSTGVLFAWVGSSRGSLA